MGFGNSGGSVDTSSLGLDTSGYSLDGGLGSYGNTGFENIPVGGLSVDNAGYQTYPSSFLDGISLGDGNSTNWGSLINTLGRLGSGVLGGLADYQTSSKMSNYMPQTRWLGNGLATTQLMNNMANKQLEKNNAYGNALMLSSLFGRGFGRRNDTIDTLPRKISEG